MMCEINKRTPSRLLEYFFHGFFFIILDEEKAKKDPQYRLKAINAETRDILNELDSTYKPEVLCHENVCGFLKLSHYVNCLWH